MGNGSYRRSKITVVDNLISDPGVNGRQDDDEEDDYGVYGDEDILDRSIQEALPQRIEEKTEVSRH